MHILELPAFNPSPPLREANLEQAQFMVFLGKLLGAKKILEVGMYTGYSALAWAEAVKGAEGAEVGLFCPTIAASSADGAGKGCVPGSPRKIYRICQRNPEEGRRARESRLHSRRRCRSEV